MKDVGAVVSAGRGAGAQLWQYVAKEVAPGFGKEGRGEPQLSVVQLDGLSGFPAAALEVELMFAPRPASNWWSSGGAPVALEPGDSPQLPLFWLVPSPVSPVVGAVDVLPALPFQSPHRMEQLAADATLA